MPPAASPVGPCPQDAPRFLKGRVATVPSELARERPPAARTPCGRASRRGGGTSPPTCTEQARRGVCESPGDGGRLSGLRCRSQPNYSATTSAALCRRRTHPRCSCRHRCPATGRPVSKRTETRRSRKTGKTRSHRCVQGRLPHRLLCDGFVPVPYLSPAGHRRGAIDNHRCGNAKRRRHRLRVARDHLRWGGSARLPSSYEVAVAAERVTGVTRIGSCGRPPLGRSG